MKIPAATKSQPSKRSDLWIILLVAGVLIVLCCLLVAVVGYWQRSHIPILAGLIGEPTATPRPTRTPRATNTPRGVPTEPIEVVVTKKVITATPLPGQEAKLCLLPDAYVDDKSYNSLAWSGLQAAAEKYGFAAVYIEPGGSGQSDYDRAMNELLFQNCELIVGVSYLTNEAINKAALANPKQKFMLLDVVMETPVNNLWYQEYAEDQGAFLAGYLAAGVSRTAKVGTFGGWDIPSVRRYMNGFASGVSYYNLQHNTSVKVLGWDWDQQTGLFTNDFVSTQQGQIAAKQLINQGADILFPVAGMASYGAAAEATTHSGIYVIGVDSDLAVSQSKYASVVLTSVEKRLDASILSAVEALVEERFEGGRHTGTIPDEISLAPFHNLDNLVSNQMRTELEQVKASILSGEIDTLKAYAPTGGSVKSGELTLWVNYNPSENLTRWVNQYQQDHPGVKVTMENMQGSAEDLWKVSVAAGTGPDLYLFTNGTSTQEWARSGYMEPVEAYLPGSLEGFSKTSLTNLTVDGVLYGIPYAGDTTLLFYNKALLPEPPQTMEDLAQLVDQGKGLSLYRSIFFLFSFITAYDGQLVDDDGRCVADLNPEFFDGLLFLKELTANGALLTNEWSVFTESFKNGEVAMTINGLWMLPEFQDALGDDLGIALIPPGIAQAAPIAGVTAFIVNPSSQSPELAVDLAYYLANPESQAGLATTGIPVRNDLDLNPDNPIWVFIEAFETGYPDSQLTANFYGPFANMLRNLFEDDMDPAEAVRDACQEMNDLNGK